MDRNSERIPVEAIREEAHVLSGAARDFDPLLQRIGDARFVLLGEATHGTHEFYGERARLTQRLIEEKGFSAVAVEADWPDAYRANRYVRQAGGDASATEALSGFQRFPTWMWRNTEAARFLEWLREHNEKHAPAQQTGFYGLDLYSLHASMQAVLDYLAKVDPEAERRARARYACFEQFGDDTEAYGFATRSRLTRSCEQEVIRQLIDLQQHATDYLQRDGRMAEDELFYAEQNARLVKNAEAYYRSVFLDEISSWNLRDRHMAETLDTLSAHLSHARAPAKIVVWAHNSHLGDARATQMGRRKELNLGQLARERYGTEAVLVGFTTHHGTVTAASDWGALAERKRVRPALAGSWEDLFHQTGIERFLLTWKNSGEAPPALRERRLERAIGVIYLPQTERASHYFWAQPADQFDAILHFDETRALEPLERSAEWDAGELPETFPFAV